MKAFSHIFKVVSWNLEVLAVSRIVVSMQGYLAEFVQKALWAHPVHNLSAIC